jgi:signal transduction histidine kinase
VRIVIADAEPAALEALKGLAGVEVVVASSREELATLAQDGDLALVGAGRLVALDKLRALVDKAAGHDLRSPLHAISMGVSLLANDPPTPEQTDVLRRIDNAIDRISDNLDKLSELSSSDSPAAG